MFWKLRQNPSHLALSEPIFWYEEGKKAMARAAASLRYSSWPWFSSRPTTAAAAAAQLSSLFTTKPLFSLPTPNDPRRRRRFFSTSLLPRTTGSKSHGLRLLRSPAAEYDPKEEDADSDGSQERKSRNELKREARRAFRWGVELATFSTPQIKRILRVASLEHEVFDALMLVKRLGPDVREGKRRQFNYIGRLLRTAQPELMDALIQASKDGDNDRLLALSSQQKWSDEDEDEEEETEDEEGCENSIQVAARWSDGLISKDLLITNEVYSIHNVEYDRQELRKLVRRVQSIQEESPGDESGVGNDGKLTRAKKALDRFLCSLAKKALAE